jgi:nucleotide-binding universal stress UspA family protein
MYKRILVPLDGSEYAEAVLPFVCLLARGSDAEIILLRVAEYPLEIYPSTYMYPPVDPRRSEAVENKKTPFRNEVEHYLEYLAQNLTSEGHSVITDVCDGPVVEAILRATEYHCVDLIAMATHTDVRRTHWLIGSVADRVLHEAKAQVILIRPNSDRSLLKSSRITGIPQSV